MKHESLFFETDIELRTDTDNNTITVAGLAAPYGRQALVRNGTVLEEFRAGVFKDELAKESGKRVILNAQHNPFQGPFARTGSGTLVLEDRPDGLYFRSNLDTRDPNVQSLAIQLERGDINGISPGFRYAKSEYRRDGQKLGRVITNAQLFEITLTHNPAYQETFVELRTEALAALTPPVTVPVFPKHLFIGANPSQGDTR